MSGPVLTSRFWTTVRYVVLSYTGRDASLLDGRTDRRTQSCSFSFFDENGRFLWGISAVLSLLLTLTLGLCFLLWSFLSFSRFVFFCFKILSVLFCFVLFWFYLGAERVPGETTDYPDLRLDQHSSRLSSNRHLRRLRLLLLASLRLSSHQKRHLSPINDTENFCFLF